MRFGLRPSAPLVQRESATRDGIATIARGESATHAMRIGDHILTFYRQTDAGAVECATAFYDGRTWELSGWAHRAVPSLPPSAWLLD